MRKKRVAALALTTAAGFGIGVASSRLFDRHIESEVSKDTATLQSCIDGEQSLVRQGDGLLYCADVRVFEMTGPTAEGANPDYLETLDGLNDRLWDGQFAETVNGVGMGLAGVVIADVVLVVGVGIHDARERAARNRGGIIRGPQNVLH